MKTTALRASEKKKSRAAANREPAVMPRDASTISQEKGIESGYVKFHIPAANASPLQFTLAHVRDYLRKNSFLYPRTWHGKPTKKQVKEYIRLERRGYKELAEELARTDSASQSEEIETPLPAKTKRKRSISDSDSSSKEEMVQTGSDTEQPVIDDPVKEKKKPRKKRKLKSKKPPEKTEGYGETEMKQAEESPVEEKTDPVETISTPKKKRRRSRTIVPEKEKPVEEEKKEKFEEKEAEIAASSSDDSEKPPKKKTKHKSKPEKTSREKKREEKESLIKKKKSRSLKEEISDDEEISSGESESSEIPEVKLPTKVKWEDKTTTAVLSFSDNAWWAGKSGYFYSVYNADKLKKKLQLELVVEIRKPFKNYKGISPKTKESIAQFGAAVVKIGDESYSPSSRLDRHLLKLQSIATEEQHAKEHKPKGDRYQPKFLEKQKYAVSWDKALTLTGTNKKREMLKSMDINYKTSEGNVYPVPGEVYHSDKLYKSAGTLLGNQLAVSFKLLYFQDNAMKLTAGGIRNYGSGKTITDVGDKHKRADAIATMLKNSRQIKSVSLYNHEKHAHSEQYMITRLANDVAVFDNSMDAIVETGKKSVIYAMVIEVYSSPNTVCDDCHPSLEKFLSTSNWKDLVTAKLNAKKTANIKIKNPEIILRVSADKPFSSTATEAIKSAKETYTVEQGKADIFFLERTPFYKPAY